jgi:hypothetical protein
MNYARSTQRSNGTHHPLPFSISLFSFLGQAKRGRRLDSPQPRRTTSDLGSIT